MAADHIDKNNNLLFSISNSTFLPAGNPGLATLCTFLLLVYYISHDSITTVRPMVTAVCMQINIYSIQIPLGSALQATPVHFVLNEYYIYSMQCIPVTK
jgi:hypothetical protein